MQAAPQPRAQLVHRSRVRRELLTQPPGLLQFVRRGAGGPQLGGEHPVQLLGDGPLAGVAAVQGQHEVTEADFGEAVADHVEGGGLLADEEHPAAPLHQSRDHVGDGLALAGAGRAVHDERATCHRGRDALPLRGIRVQDQRGPFRRLDLVDQVEGGRFETYDVVGQSGVRTQSNCAYQGVRQDQLLVLLEVSVHRLPVRGEQTQHRTLAHSPAVLPPDGRAGSREDSSHVHAVDLGDIAPVDTQARELHGEGGVVNRVLPLGLVEPGPAGAVSSELDGDQHKGSRTGFDRSLLAPVQHPDTEPQDPEPVVVEHLAGFAPQQGECRVQAGLRGLLSDQARASVGNAVCRHDRHEVPPPRETRQQWGNGRGAELQGCRSGVFEIEQPVPPPEVEKRVPPGVEHRPQPVRPLISGGGWRLVAHVAAASRRSGTDDHEPLPPRRHSVTTYLPLSAPQHGEVSYSVWVKFLGSRPILGRTAGRRGPTSAPRPPTPCRLPYRGVRPTSHQAKPFCPVSGR